MSAEVHIVIQDKYFSCHVQYVKECHCDYLLSNYLHYRWKVHESCLLVLGSLNADVTIRIVQQYIGNDYLLNYIIQTDVQSSGTFDKGECNELA